MRRSPCISTNFRGNAAPCPTSAPERFGDAGRPRHVPRTRSPAGGIHQDPVLGARVNAGEREPRWLRDPLPRSPLTCCRALLASTVSNGEREARTSGGAGQLIAPSRRLNSVGSRGDSLAAGIDVVNARRPLLEPFVRASAFSCSRTSASAPGGSASDCT